MPAWLESDASECGVQLLSDAEICELVDKETASESEDEEQCEELEEDRCPVSNSEAAYMFEQCLTWLEHQEANAYNTTLLRQLHSLAAGKRMESLEQTLKNISEHNN